MLHWLWFWLSNVTVDDAAFLLAALLYGLAGATLLAHLAGAAKRAVPVAWGLRLLGAAATLHALHAASRWISPGRGPFAGIGEALSTLGLLVVVGFLAVRRFQRRVEVVGVFVAPLTLLMLVASRAPAGHVGHLSGALLALHVGSVILGTASFTVAFAMALAYLLQERQVKRKRLGGVFQRLPPLDVLDELGYRCVAVGLPALTLGIVTGLFAGARAGSGQGAMGAWQQYVGMVAWALFAGVLVLRLAAGWRGRRAAIGTILGYASALVVLAGYYARTGSP